MPFIIGGDSLNYSNMNKKELLKIRSELRNKAQTQMSRFDKLKGDDTILQKYQPYQLYLEISKKSSSGDRAIKGMRMNDTRNKVLADITMLDKILNQEASTVTGARKVFEKQIENHVERIQENAKERDVSFTKKELREMLKSKEFYKFLHSKQFKELQKVNKKASEEAIDFYVRNSKKYSMNKIYEHFNEFLNSEDEITVKEVFPTDLNESKYIKNKAKKRKGVRKS